MHVAALAMPACRTVSYGRAVARVSPAELAAGMMWLDRHFVRICMEDDANDRLSLAQPTVDYLIDKARMAVLRYV